MAVYLIPFRYVFITNITVILRLAYDMNSDYFGKSIASYINQGNIREPFHEKIDPDQLKHAAQADPDKLFSPHVDCLIRNHYSIPLSP